MSSNRLGKGLEALIRPEKEPKKKKRIKRSSANPGVSEILISDIRPNPNQPRREFDEITLEELASSIKLKGVVTPITVRPVENGFESSLQGNEDGEHQKFQRRGKFLLT